MNKIIKSDVVTAESLLADPKIHILATQGDNTQLTVSIIGCSDGKILGIAAANIEKQLNDIIPKEILSLGSQFQK